FAVRLDLDEGVRRINLRLRLGTFLRGQRKIEIEGNQQPARSGRGDAQKASSAMLQFVRKVDCGCHGACPLLELLRSSLDRGANADIGAAAAEIPPHRLLDICLCRPGSTLQQSNSTHDLAALTVPVLHATPKAVECWDRRPPLWADRSR